MSINTHFLDLKVDTKTTFKKIFNYFSIFTIVLGTAFGTFNTAYADRIVVDAGGAVTALDEDNDGAGVIVELTDAEVAGDAVTDAMTIQALTNDDADSTLAITGSLTVNDSITTTGLGTSDMIITVTDNITSSLSVGGNVTEGGANGVIQVILDGAEQGLTISGTGVTIDATVTASTVADGILTVTGTATFADEVGYALDGSTDAELATITVSGASTFSEEVGALDININADTTMAKTIDANTIDIVGSTLTASGAVALANGGTATVIDLDDSTGTAKLVLGGALTGSITTDDGEGVLETAAGGGATISGNVGTSAAGLSLVTVTGTATISGNLYATTATVAENKVFNTDGATIVVSAEIQGLTDGVGEVEVGGATTFSSNVGTSAKSLAVLDIDAQGTFSGNIDATTMTVDATTTVAGTLTATTVTSGGATANSALTAASDVTVTNYILTDATDTLTLTGSDATVTGTIKGAADSKGVIAVNGTKITFASAIGTGAATPDKMTIADGKRAVINKTANFIDRIDIADGGELEISTDVTSGVVFTTDASMVEADVTGSSTKIYMPTNLVGGETLVLFEIFTKATTDAAAEADMNVALQDTAITDYSGDFDGTDTDQMNVVATAKSAVTTASELSVTTNMATALHQANAAAISSGDTSALAAFNNALNAHNGYSATTDTDLAKQVAPQTDLISGSSVAAQAVTGSVQGIMSNRMASLRSGDAYFGTGVAAGGMSAQSGFIQVFGSTAEQKDKTVGSGIQSGFDSDTQGLAIGFDGTTDNGMTVGVSLATANTDVDGKGTGKSKNSIDSYSASIYMDKATDAGYIEGSLTYGVNENSTSRKVNTAGLDRTYTGSYDSSSLSFNISAGIPNEVGNGGYVTPFGALTVTSMDTDAYTEKSTVANDNLRLNVTQDDLLSTVGTVGIKFHNEMSNGGTPMISLALNSEFGDSTIDSTNTYQGGGTAFKTSTDVEEFSATLGLGYSYGSDAASIEFAYEADINDDDYLSQYGSIKLVGKF